MRIAAATPGSEVTAWMSSGAFWSGVVVQQSQSSLLELELADGAKVTLVWSFVEAIYTKAEDD